MPYKYKGMRSFLYAAWVEKFEKSNVLIAI